MADCGFVKELIPEWLDGELPDETAKEIAAHVASCTSCQQEVYLWQSISQALRTNLEHIKAPPGFADGVMAKLPTKRFSLRHTVYTRWQKNLAAAAAFLLVAAGSAGAYLQWGVNQAAHLAGSNEQPGYVVHSNPGDNENDIEPDNFTAVNQDNASSPVVTEQPAGDNAKVSDKSGNQDTGTKDNQPPSSAKPQVAMTANNDDVQQIALLSTENNLVIKRTFLKVGAADLNSARSTALDYISKAGGEYEILGASDNNLSSQISIKVIIADEAAGNLLGNLKALGKLIDANQQEENITARYNENVEQYNTLAAQIEALDDQEKADQFQVKLATIKSQLSSWDHETKMHTIILWLEE